MILQQASTVRPLMRQSVIFALIARRTGEYQITGIACAAARHRNNMIDMITIFQRSMSASCIITTSLLPLVLLSHVIGSESTALLYYFCAMSDASRSGDLLAAFSLSVVFACFQYLIAVLEVTAPRSSGILFRMGCLIVALPFVGIFWMFFLVSTMIAPSAFSTPTMQSGVYIFLFAAEIFDRGREFLAALGTALERIGDIQHSNLLSLRLGFEVGAAPRNAVVRQIIKPPQAQFNYSIKAG